MEKKSTLSQLIEAGELDLVTFSPGHPERELDAALRHYQSAVQILESDPEGSFQLLYDSARKTLQALLSSEGIRVRKPPNANHYTFVKVVKSGFVDSETWNRLDWMRKLRNQTEYPEPETLPASIIDSRQAMDHVAAMLADAKSRLGVVNIKN